MTVDTTELSTLTNKRLAGIVGEAIKGIRDEEKPRSTLKDLLRNDLEGQEYNPREGDVVFYVGTLYRIGLGQVDANGIIPFEDVMGGQVGTVHRLDNKVIVGFEINLSSGGTQKVITPNNDWALASLLGTVDGTKLVLKNGLRNGLARKVPIDGESLQIEKLGKVRDFLRGPSMFKELDVLLGIGRSAETFSRAVTAFEAYEKSKMIEILGNEEHIYTHNLKPGQAIAYFTPLSPGIKHNLFVFDGVTLPEEAERYICFRYVNESKDSEGSTITLSTNRRLVPYKSSNFYLGVGRVYNSFEEMQTRYRELALHVVRVNMVVKQLIAQHLGVSLEEA